MTHNWSRNVRKVIGANFAQLNEYDRIIKEKLIDISSAYYGLADATAAVREVDNAVSETLTDN